MSGGRLGQVEDMRCPMCRPTQKGLSKYVVVELLYLMIVKLWLQRTLITYLFVRSYD